MADKKEMRYRDELDKSYGVAGMALGLTVFEANDLFTAVTLDADGPGCIQFTPEFFFAGNPRLSPRGAWKYILGHYRISVGLTVANALCRRMVLDNGKVDDRLRDQLFNAAFEDGRDYCQLERDEVEPIFDEAFMCVEIHTSKENDITVIIFKICIPANPTSFNWIFTS